MAGASGCIPDYQVNFFGQLCQNKPTSSAVPAPVPEPKSDLDPQPDTTPTQSHTSVPAPEPDSIAKLLQENQNRVRSPARHVREVFAEVRRDRAMAAQKPQQLLEHSQVELLDGNEAAYRDQHQDQNESQHSQQQSFVIPQCPKTPTIEPRPTPESDVLDAIGFHWMGHPRRRDYLATFTKAARLREM